MMTAMNGRRSDNGAVPDLTPHINDPLEHLRNIFKGFCRQNLDLGDNRQPPVVVVDTLATSPTPQVCGFLCMDSQFQEVEPCLPSCSNEQVEMEETSDESSVTNGHFNRALLIEDPSSSHQELRDREIADTMEDNLT